ncbi:hypothetical protein CEXT_692681 [Caerostris extrusa]|uniref:Uncharacterized protein n=1 Tax=Caerostris extrusa TaxID=172846 RepID=A0AAV4QM80_CAEEX|nr:hypothetical protein CEXT_692681 [Caerostris extrusa]
MIRGLKLLASNQFLSRLAASGTKCRPARARQASNKRVRRSLPIIASTARIPEMAHECLCREGTGVFMSGILTRSICFQLGKDGGDSRLERHTCD